MSSHVRWHFNLPSLDDFIRLDSPLALPAVAMKKLEPAFDLSGQNSRCSQCEVWVITYGFSLNKLKVLMRRKLRPASSHPVHRALSSSAT
eukprot:s831_g10.t1